ncbi:MAG: 1-deoxy-D-xylulose-5-phosphate reductoisomerase, partial [bacterium]
LEVIEARWLFGLPPEKIEVLIHRQSIVHALVEFEDGSVIAQLGLPDMRTPIAACLAHPERIPLKLPRLDLAQVGKLEFEAVPPERYPAFFLALEAMRAGGGMPALLNGANETVVAAYLDDAFPFTEIAAILGRVMRKADSLAKSGAPPPCLAAIRAIADAVEADGLGRALAAEMIAELRAET